MSFVADVSTKVYVAGHRGMVGSAIVRALESGGFRNILVRTSAEPDLRVQAQVDAFFEQERPDYVFLAAAKVGGILANDCYPAEFIYDNLVIETNIIHAAHAHAVKNSCFSAAPASTRSTRRSH